MPVTESKLHNKKNTQCDPQCKPYPSKQLLIFDLTKVYCVRHQLFQCNFGIFIANEAAEENRKKKRDGSNKYLYELDFSSALKTARKFFMRRDSGRHIDIIRLMMKYVHAVKDRFRQFQRPLRGISAIHFGYR